MIDRRRLPSLIGLIALVILPAAAAVWMVWYATDVQQRVSDFYESAGNAVIPNEVYRQWDTLQQQGYTLQQFATPLLTVAVFALLALIAVLARRWDVTRRDQADAADAFEAASAP